MESPTSKQVKAARLAAGMTQKQAAAAILSPNYRTWQNWEAGIREMPPGLFELFLLKTGQKELEIITKIP